MAPSFLSLIQTHKVQKGLLSNFFIWLIPGVLVLCIVLLVILVSLVGGDGQLLTIEMKTPKGFLSFLSLGLILSGLGSSRIFVFINSISVELIMSVFFFTFICILIGDWLLNKEVRRLHQT